jgi:hypothetical protein
MRQSGDLNQFKLGAYQFTVDIADNTAVTLCAAPANKRCYGVVLADQQCDSGAYVESLNWAATTGFVVVTPQVTSNKSGKATFLVLFRE